MINVDALTEQGQVRKGYELEAKSPDPNIDAANCSEPSAAGISPNTYACGASVYSADACWRHADGDLACLYLPWDRELSRRSITGKLPETPAADDPEPLGVQLEDGSRYRMRNGMSAGLPPEGFNDVYFCVSGPCGDDPNTTLAILAGIDSPRVVNQNSDTWTVTVGAMASDETDAHALPEPEAQRVVRAWFITTE